MLGSGFVVPKTLARASAGRTLAYLAHMRRSYPLTQALAWRGQDAIAWVRRLLAEDGAARPLAAFLPAIPADASHRALRCRAAVASTFIAGLELARENTLTLIQESDFGVLTLQPIPAAALLP